MAEQSEASKVQLAKLFAKLFIARPELKAVQVADGGYRPLNGEPFKLHDLLAHINGEKTYGHYQVNSDDDVKLMCFDIDLKKIGMLPTIKNGMGQFMAFKEVELREYWGSRKPGPGRDFIKLKLKMLASQLASAVKNELEIPTAVAYSGSKGVHVYGFTGKTSSTLARDGADIILDSLQYKQQGHWELIRGQNFFGYVVDPERANDPCENYSQFEMETFPKQETVEGKDKGLGNLIRLPLGVNYKSPLRDKGFFLDMRTAMDQFSPRDPVESLTTNDPWQ